MVFFLPHNLPAIALPGAYAELIAVDGNPLENIQLIADPQKNFLLIMKGGIIYQNALRP